MHNTLKTRDIYQAPAGIVPLRVEPSDPDSDEINLGAIWRTLLKRRWIIIGCLLAAVTFSVAYYYLKTPRYEALALLNVNPEGSGSLDLEAIPLADEMDWNAKLETQVKILTTNKLAMLVITDLSLFKSKDFVGVGDFAKKLESANSITDLSQAQKNALTGIFESNLRVKSVPRTHVIEIRFRSTNAKLAADVVNHLVNDYMEEGFIVRYQATAQASDWLSKQLEDLKKDVATAQQKLSDYQKQSGILGTDENDNVVMSRLSDLSKQVTSAQADMIIKEAKYRLAATGNPEAIGTVAPDSTLPGLSAREADLKGQLAQANTTYGPGYPRVQQLNNQLAETEREIRAETQNIQTRFKTEFEAAQSTETALTASLEQQKQRAYKQSDDYSQFGILKRDVESGRDLYEDLLKRLKEAGIIAGLKSTNVDVIEAATVPTSPVEPNLTLDVALAIAGGLFLGVLLATLAELADHTIGDPDQVQALTGLSILAAIPPLSAGRSSYAYPRLKSTKRARLRSAKHKAQSPVEKTETFVPATIAKPRSAFAEAVRGLRTSLLLAKPGSSPQVVMINSPLSGEGKTTVSINTAIVFAQAGSTVLLVDGDLRRGAIQSRLGLTESAGLSACLSGMRKWQDVIVELQSLPNVHILCAGSSPPNPSELLISNPMHELLEEWRKIYDLIIIDTPPCVSVTDAVAISPWVDGLVLVARIGRTGKHPLINACDMFRRVRAPLLGAVVNDFDPKSQYYGYGYGNYYAYYGDDETVSPSLKNDQ